MKSIIMYVNNKLIGGGKLNNTLYINKKIDRDYEIASFMNW